MTPTPPSQRQDEYERRARVDPGQPVGSGTDTDLVARRILAFLVDTVVVLGSILGLARRHTQSTAGRAATTAIVAPVVGAGYHVALEGRFGQTVGKRLSGIEVRRIDGARSGYGAAAGRTGLRVVDWLPVGYLVGLASIWLSGRDRRLGDLVAGTVVVRSLDARWDDD